MADTTSTTPTVDPAPTNILVTVSNAVIDTLIKGLGADAAVTIAVSYAPALALPVISSLFKYLVNWLAGILDKNIEQNVDVIEIRFQNTLLKDAYIKAVAAATQPGATDADIQNAFNAIDNMVNRNK